MTQRIDDAANKWTTVVYDMIQYKQQKIVFWEGYIKSKFKNVITNIIKEELL